MDETDVYSTEMINAELSKLEFFPALNLAEIIDGIMDTILIQKVEPSDGWS